MEKGAADFGRQLSTDFVSARERLLAFQSRFSPPFRHDAIRSAACRSGCRERIISFPLLACVTGAVAYSTRPSRHLPPRIRRENVILRRYRRMTCVAACGAGAILRGPGVSRQRVSGGIVEKSGVGPAMGVRKSRAVFFDERQRLQRIRHIHEIGGLRILL